MEEELKKELKEGFSEIVWDLDGIIEEEGALEATKTLIGVLWEQYYMKAPAFPKSQILEIIGALEGLLRKYGSNS